MWVQRVQNINTFVQGVSEVTPVFYFEAYNYFCEPFSLKILGE
jgi:hypothetical protein